MGTMRISSDGDEPIKPGAPLPDVGKPIKCTLRVELKTANDGKNRLRFYFDRDPDEGISDLGDLGIPITKNRNVTITLDRDVAWSFQYDANDADPVSGNAITLGKNARKLYRNLNHIVGSDGRCMEASFDAVYFDDTKPSRDGFNMFVVLDTDDGKTVPLRIDPDIKNPGDHY